MRAAFSGTLCAFCVVTAAQAQSLRPAGAPLGLPPGAGATKSVPSSQTPPPGGQPILRPLVDLYPASLAARIAQHLPPLPSIAPERLRTLHTRVNVQLDDAGVAVVAELVTPSGEPAYDAAVLDTVAGFTSNRGAFGPLPMPEDPERRQVVTHRGIAVDVRPLAPRAAGPFVPRAPSAPVQKAP